MVSLVNTARKDWMTLENLHTEMPLTDDFSQPPLPANSGLVRCRSIYDAAAMDNPAARQIIEVCTEAGEQARILPKVPMKTKLADQTTAMLPLTPTGTAGALVIRVPLITAALREYFEMLWDRATPLRKRRTPSGQGRRAYTRPAGGAGVDGRRPPGRCHRPPGRAQYHHRPATHYGHPETSRCNQQIRRRRRRTAPRLDRIDVTGVPAGQAPTRNRRSSRVRKA
jgi:hypothetical protein